MKKPPRAAKTVPETVETLAGGVREHFRIDLYFGRDGRWYADMAPQGKHPGVLVHANNKLDALAKVAAFGINDE